MNIPPIKIGLVQINNSFSGQSYLPLSIGFIQSYAQHTITDIPLLFNEFIYKRLPIKDAVEHLKDNDIIGISLYVWNFELSMAIAKRIKEQYPDKLIVVGGCSVPEENTKTLLEKHPYIDIAVNGAGEIPFSNIIQSYNKLSKTWFNIPNITWRYNDSIITNESDTIYDIDTIPSPFLTGTFDNIINKDEKWIALLETNRGCPFSCSFCNWGMSSKTKVSCFNIERVFDEIKWLAEKHIEFVFICDANFGLLKNRDMEIAKRFVLMKTKYGYPHAVSVQNTKNSSHTSFEIQKILSDGGLSKGTLLAFQSLNQSTLQAIDRINIDLNTFQEIQTKCHQANIKTFSDIILGLPEETYDSYVYGIEQLIKMGQHNKIQFNNLSLLPNTKMNTPEYKERYNIQTVVSDIINIHGSTLSDEVPEKQELVIGTKTMPQQDWVQARTFSYIISLLYFDKVLQIPLVIINKIWGLSYTKIIENFIEYANKEETPIIYYIIQAMEQHSKNIQQGGPEFIASNEYLDIWWPIDEFYLIDIIAKNKLNQFYQETIKIFEKILDIDDYSYPILLDAIRLNHNLFKKPTEPSGNITINTTYNIWEMYKSHLINESTKPESKGYKYNIIRKHWTIDEWYKKVIWWLNKKGEYLYDVQ